MSASSSLAADFQQLVATVTTLTAELRDCQAELIELRDRVRLLENHGVESFTVVDTPVVGPPPVTAAAYRLSATRVEAAQSVGRWIRRSLDGLHRGLSGRERITQANKYFIIARDFEGNLYNPPQVLDNWAATKSLCQRRGQLGDSIFVGLPTRAEVKIAVGAASLEVPAAFEAA